MSVLMTPAAFQDLQIAQGGSWPKDSAWESHWEVSLGRCPGVLAGPGGKPCPHLPVGVMGRCRAQSDASLAIPSPLPGSNISDLRHWVLDSPTEAGTGTPCSWPRRSGSLETAPSLFTSFLRSGSHPHLPAL